MQSKSKISSSSESECESKYSSREKQEALLEKIMFSRNLRKSHLKTKNITTEKMPRKSSNIKLGKKLSLSDLGGALTDTKLAGRLESAQLNLDENKTTKAIKEISEKKNERKTCYRALTRKMSKWNPVVRKHKKAKTLCFYEKQSPAVFEKSLNNIADSYTPETQFEKNFQTILKNSNLLSTPSTIKELTEKQKISKNELADRARRKSIAFERRIEDRRVKKIKSKRYRKSLKLQKRREQDRLLKDGLAASEDKEKLLSLRAEERMNLRHKNTGKWAKNIAKKPFLVKKMGLKEDIIEKERKEKSLRTKVKDSSSESDSEEDNSKISEENEGNQGNKDGVFGLKFMQKAVEKKTMEGFEELSEEQFKLDKIGGDKGTDRDEIVIELPEKVDEKEFEGEENLIKNDGKIEEKEIKKFVGESNNKKNDEAYKIKDRETKFKKEEINPDFYTDSEEFVPLGESDSDNGVEIIVSSKENKKDFDEEKSGLKNQKVPAENKNLGWGSWAGPGIKEKKTKKDEKEVYKEKKDKNTSNKDVIINYEAIQANLKPITLRERPRKFKSDEEYEEWLGGPLGKEWKRADEFREGVRPKVLARKGVAIEPIEIKDDLSKYMN